MIDVSISTPGREIARQIVRFRRTHFQLGNLHSSLVGYKSHAEYAFPEKQTRHPRFENAADSVLCTPNNDECKFSQLEMFSAEVYCMSCYCSPSS